jgi:hypothetical protein
MADDLLPLSGAGTIERRVMSTVTNLSIRMLSAANTPTCSSDSESIAARSLGYYLKAFTQLLLSPSTSLLHYGTLINIERRV